MTLMELIVLSSSGDWHYSIHDDDDDDDDDK
jgi:hypothetical protein